jgi:hypothetical protein
MVFAFHTNSVHAIADGPTLSATKVYPLIFKLQHDSDIHRLLQQLALIRVRMEVLAPIQMSAPVQPDGVEPLALFVCSIASCS